MPSDEAGKEDTYWKGVASSDRCLCPKHAEAVEGFRKAQCATCVSMFGTDCPLFQRFYDPQAPRTMSETEHQAICKGYCPDYTAGLSIKTPHGTIVQQIPEPDPDAGAKFSAVIREYCEAHPVEPYPKGEGSYAEGYYAGAHEKRVEEKTLNRLRYDADFWEGFHEGRQKLLLQHRILEDPTSPGGWLFNSKCKDVPAPKPTPRD